jgi:hypothetical protein
MNAVPVRAPWMVSAGQNTGALTSRWLLSQLGYASTTVRLCGPVRNRACAAVLSAITPSRSLRAEMEAALELVLVAVEPDRQQDYGGDSSEKKSNEPRHGHEKTYHRRRSDSPRELGLVERHRRPAVHVLTVARERPFGQEYSLTGTGKTRLVGRREDGERGELGSSLGGEQGDATSVVVERVKRLVELASSVRHSRTPIL